MWASARHLQCMRGVPWSYVARHMDPHRRSHALSMRTHSIELDRRQAQRNESHISQVPKITLHNCTRPTSYASCRIQSSPQLIYMPRTK